MSSAKLLFSVVVLALLAGGTFYYYRPAEGKPAPAAAQATNDVLVFTSPPREPPEDAELTYKPIADYLSGAIGKRVVYKYPSTWGLYRTEMLNGSYDIILDGPHFTDYRAQKMQYNVLVKMPQIHEFVIIVRKDENISSVAQLVGKTFCSEPPPNLGSLVALAQFEDPGKQPVIVPTKGWKSIYAGVASQRCVGGVLPLATLTKFDTDGLVKVVFKNRGLPNQAFSAGPRVSPDVQAKIAAALTAPEAADPTEKLRARFNVGDRFVTTSNTEYAGVALYLRNEFGFEAIAAK